MEHIGVLFGWQCSTTFTVVHTSKYICIASMYLLTNSVFHYSFIYNFPKQINNNNPLDSCRLQKVEVSRMFFFTSIKKPKTRKQAKKKIFVSQNGMDYRIKKLKVVLIHIKCKDNCCCCHISPYGRRVGPISH